MDKLLGRIKLLPKVFSIGLIVILAFVAITAFFIVPQIRTVMYEGKQEKLQSLVSAAEEQVERYYLLSEEGVLTEEEAQAAAIQAVSFMRYEGENYLWINDLSKILMHPVYGPEDKPEWYEENGIALLEDVDGKQFLLEATEIAADEGDAFVEYQWTKPGETGKFPKLSYVKLFPKWDWVVASGIYVDDVDQQVAGVSRTVYMIVAVVAVLASAYTFYMTRSITSPMAVIVEGADKIAEGDAHLEGMDEREIARIRERGDELGDIGRAFDGLIAYFQEMAEAAQRIAEGDLRADVEPRSARDLLGNAFEEMIANLRELIGQMTDSANSVGAAANQLSAASSQAGQATEQIATTVQQIANGAQEQTESTTRTAESVDEMARAIDGVAKGGQEQAAAVGKAADVTAQISKVIQDVAQSAQEGAGVSAQAADTARDGSETVERNLKAMGVIKQQVDLSAEKVAEMGRRSEEIGVIVETIDDIASQTNLLALNAAIEAARAGEHGEGFAVVADEVRKLAEESTAATSEIAGLIKSIQETVAEAVQAMDSSASEVDRGVEGANEAGEALREILTAARNVNQQVENIAAASEELSASADELVSSNDAVSAVVEENTAATEEMSANSSQVTESIETITSISEENSAAVEEVSASAEEMNAQVEEVTASAHSLADMAKDLTAAVSRFKLGAGQSLVSNIKTYKKDHQVWVNRLREMLAGRESLSEEEAGSHETCLLGRWYYDQGRELEGLRQYERLEGPHMRLHQEVAKTISAHNRGNQAEASTGLKNVESLSRSVVDILDELEYRAVEWVEKSRNGKNGRAS
jgi:methyl-accepting chemotaxis protein